MTTLLLSMDVSKKQSLSAEDLPKLMGRLPVWAAMVGSIAVLAAQTAGPYSKKLPSAPDILQLAYLGMAENFVTDDDKLYEAARDHVAPLVPGQPEVLAPPERTISTLP